MLFSEISSLVILWAGGFMVMGKDITLGEFVAFNSYIGILTWPMMAVGFITNLYQRGSASMDRLNQILMEQPEITDSPGARPMQKVRGHIEIKNLTFSYGKELMEPALRNMWLEIEAGETVAITGRIGSGKSTLIKLLTRLYDPPGGKIFLDGVDILEVQLKDLRNAISVVPQIPFLFSEKIGVNVELGNPESTAERVNEIIGIVKLEEGTRHNGIGYDTLVGERGITLSGGQKQRVTIARGLIKDSQILILDDVLSSVDTRTEDEILSALPSMISGRTTIIISHRVSALKVARRIYVFEKGRVAELGTHEELSHSGGYYSELCRKQRLAQFGLR
jgi:ATP-binding cassette subfamily B protein